PFGSTVYYRHHRAAVISEGTPRIPLSVAGRFSHRHWPSVHRGTQWGAFRPDRFRNHRIQGGRRRTAGSFALAPDAHALRSPEREEMEALDDRAHRDISHRDADQYLHQSLLGVRRTRFAVG